MVPRAQKAPIWDSGVVRPEWFEALTCNIWLHLEYRPLDSAWFLGVQIWYFQPRNPFVDPRIPDLDPGVFRLGWGPFWAKNDPRKNMILCWKWSPMGFEGDLCEGNGLYGTQEAFGQARFPPNPLTKWFYRDFPISRKNPWAPWPSMVIPSAPLWGWPIQLPINPPWWAC